jgi:hypothetical protein
MRLQVIQTTASLAKNFIFQGPATVADIYERG